MQVESVAPPGWKHTVEKMKKHKDIENPFAIAWYLKKRGAKPHREDTDADAVFDRALLAALTNLQSSGMPHLCTMAANGDQAACSLLLDASMGPWIPERRW